MAIVIKEIHVLTVIEKKVVRFTDISGHLLDRIKEDVILELQGQQQQDAARMKKER